MKNIYGDVLRCFLIELLHLKPVYVLFKFILYDSRKKVNAPADATLAAAAPAAEAQKQTIAPKPSDMPWDKRYAHDNERKEAESDSGK
jgi:hypothetical protein